MRKENKIYCNSCGKRIVDTIGRDMEEYIHIEKNLGISFGKRRRMPQLRSV